MGIHGFFTIENGIINDHLLVGGDWNHGIFLGNLWLIYG